MTNGFDIFGVIASALGITSIIQIIVVIINARLPLKWLRTFDQTHRETEALLHSIAEEGLFEDEGQYITHKNEQITMICGVVEFLRSEAYTAKTYKEEIKQWWGGLSGRISMCCDEIKGLRAQISSTSSKAREALAQCQKDSPDQGVSSFNGASDGVPNSGTKEPAVETKGSNETTGDQELPSEAARDESPPADSPSHWQMPSSAGTSPSPQHVTAQTDKDDARSPCNVYDSARARSDSTISVPPPYKRNSIPPPYPSPSCPRSNMSHPLDPPIYISRTTRVFVRKTSDSTRIARKLLRAHHRNFLTQNSQCDFKGGRHHQAGGPSAAASSRDLDRPSVSPRSWKALRKCRGVLSTYVTAASSCEIAFAASPDPMAIVEG